MGRRAPGLFTMRHNYTKVFVVCTCVIVSLCSCADAYLYPGSWGGKHWQLTVAADGVSGTVEGDCSSGTISNVVNSSFISGVGTYYNFSMQLGLQFSTPATAASVNVSDGILASDNVTLTGTMVTGSYSEQFKVVRLGDADLFKCINGGITLQAGWMPLVMALLTLIWLQS